MIDFRKLQNEADEWQRRNFPNSSALETILGVVEEVGELVHTILKSRQGIRYNEVEARYKMRDAVGDIVMYLINFCNYMGWDFAEVVEETWEQVKDRDWVKYPKNGKTE